MERLREAAIINAVALALAKVRNNLTFQLSLKLAKKNVSDGERRSRRKQLWHTWATFRTFISDDNHIVNVAPGMETIGASFDHGDTNHFDPPRPR